MGRRDPSAGKLVVDASFHIITMLAVAEAYVMPWAVRGPTMSRPAAQTMPFVRCSNSNRRFCRPVRSSTRDISTDQANDVEPETNEEPRKFVPPWTNPLVLRGDRKTRNNNRNRFRQHVNPLASQYQMQAELSAPDWPTNVFQNVNKPLHLDIGCGKGGFLIDLASNETTATDTSKKEAPVELSSEMSMLTNKQPPKIRHDPQTYPYNYLGLEIRPGVAQFARERISIHKLDGVLEFVGCNANVDLDRLLSLYKEQAANVHSEEQTTDSSLLLRRVTIQYPDPHFKSQHAKRRVVTDDLVDVLAKHMPPNTSEGSYNQPESSFVFLQSDVQSVLDDMRQVFGNCTKYFQDAHVGEPDYYIPDNILGVPTEREVSVLVKDLPVYRAVFYRTSMEWQETSRAGEMN